MEMVSKKSNKYGKKGKIFMLLKIDNQKFKALAYNPSFQLRTKHIDI